jgi:hypothetical protein
MTCLRTTLLLLVLLPAVFLSAGAAGPTTSFSIGGAGLEARNVSLDDLQALSAVTQTVAFETSHGAQTRTFTGASLWSLLERSGLTNAAGARREMLDRLVVATGSDGYTVVFSLPELDPAFGNKQSLVAYAQMVDGRSTPLGAEGFASLTAPHDVHGGRYVHSLASLRVQACGSTQAGSGGGPSKSFAVSGAVSRPMQVDLAALRALPAERRSVGGDTYIGASLWDLLEHTVGLRDDAASKNDVLAHFVVATGSDGYRAVFSLGELSPKFGNQPDIVAYERNGQLLTERGFARIVAPNDLKPGRFVSNLVSLEVFKVDSAPMPGAAR